MKHNTEVHSPVINDLNSFAVVFAAAVKDYNLVDDPNGEILDRHCGLLATFMEKMGANCTIGIHNTLIKLMRCYNKHTTDSPVAQETVMKYIEDMLMICITIAQYSNHINEWEWVFSAMSKTIDNANNEKR